MLDVEDEVRNTFSILLERSKMMIPQVHGNERERGEQAPWWRSKNLLQRVIGVLVLFVVGLVAPTSNTAVGAGFFAVLGAAWLDTWWACLVVPFALVAGYVLRQLPNAGFELDSIVLLALSACVGAILGTAFFKWKEIWRWIRGRSL
jgi:hypothetical protein